jgi:putative hemolysin
MAATMLNNPIAVEASVAVVRTFIKFREILSQNKNMSRRLNERKPKYDHQFKAVFETIRKLMQLRQNDIKRTRIRYRRSNEKDKDE